MFFSVDSEPLNIARIPCIRLVDDTNILMLPLND